MFLSGSIPHFNRHGPIKNGQSVRQVLDGIYADVDAFRLRSESALNIGEEVNSDAWVTHVTENYRRRIKR